MPCFKVGENGFSTPASGSLFMGAYATEAECLNACKEGACCESNNTCSVKPQCQCQGAGQTFRGVGTVCTPNPCGVCSCVDIPLYFDMTFAGFNYQWAGPSSQLTGYGQQLTDFVHSLSLRLTLRTAGSVRGSFARYASDGGCYSLPSCSQATPCGNPAYQWLVPETSAELFLDCSGSVRGVKYYAATQPSCWQQFAGNRINHFLQTQGDWRDGGRAHPSFPFGLCPSNRNPLLLPTPPNPGILQSYASWNIITDVAFYTSQTGEVRLTPTYANPLP